MTFEVIKENKNKIITSQLNTQKTYPRSSPAFVTTALVNLILNCNLNKTDPLFYFYTNYSIQH